MLDRLGRMASHIALALVLITLPLPRYWPLLDRKISAIFHNYISLDLYVSDAAIALLLLSSAAWIRKTGQPSAEPKLLVYPLALLAVLAALSSLWALDLLLAMQMAVRLLWLLASTLVIIRLRPEPHVAQAGLVLLVLVQSAVALLQFGRQGDLGLTWLGEVDISPSPGHSILAVDDQIWLRGYGLTSHPNILGGVLALTVLALVAPFLVSRGVQKALLLLVLLLAAAGLFISFSRSAWLGTATGGLFLAIAIGLHRPWRRDFGRSLALLGLVAALLLLGLAWRTRPLLLSRVSPAGSAAEQRSIDERNALSAAGGTLFRSAPLTGVGAGNTTPALLPLLREQRTVTPQPIHNVPFLLAVELGLPGAALWVWLMIFPMLAAVQRLRHRQLTPWALALTSALVAFAVIDLFDYYAWGGAQGSVLRWVFWGLWAAEISRPAGVEEAAINDFPPPAAY